MDRKELFVETARLAAEAAVEINQTAFRITEAADGSGRWVALIGWDEDTRIFSPSPADAPVWAQTHTGYSREQLQGDGRWQRVV